MTEEEKAKLIKDLEEKLERSSSKKSSCGYAIDRKPWDNGPTHSKANIRPSQEDG